ncbi:MAG TPA: YncE family protein [Terracidiphilus sp.]|jgi:DNA-binding beta-propeller fold protein YncE
MRRVFTIAVMVVSIRCSAQTGAPCGEVLELVADLPMPGPAARFDYQSMDAEHERLYISHMNADQLVVFDISKRAVVANLDGFKRVHGVIAVPEVGRVFASATGDHQMIALDMHTLKVVGKAGPIDYPDGLAYSPAVRRVFVSDEHGGVDAVVNEETSKLIKNIPLGGYAGNTVYDPGSGHILVAVHGVNELVEIDPEAMQIIARHKLTGIKNPHGIALDVQGRLAFIAGEENHSLAVFNLKESKQLAVHQVGDDPDVLAFDAGLRLLYVSAESGTVSVFREAGHDVVPVGHCNMPHAHTVSVDPKTHLVYFPLESLDGKAVLRIMRPKMGH